MTLAPKSHRRIFISLSVQFTFWSISIFGTSCAAEVAQKMVEKHFGNISVALHISDDIIIGGKEEQEHDLILCKVLTRARERSIKFNRDKI